MKKPSVGDHVIWVDSVGKEHNALVQMVWTEKRINCLFVSSDDNRQDSYGRQIEHATSCMHVTESGVHGFYWRWPDEPSNSYAPPEQR